MRRPRRILVLAAALLLAAGGGWVFRLAEQGDAPPGSDAPAASAGHVVEPQMQAKELPQGIGDFAAAFRAGLRNFQAGDAHAAARAFEKAVSIRPHEVQARVNLGFAYIALGRPAEARTLFERALAFAPMTANAYYGLAEALEAEGDLEGAMGAMRTFVHLAEETDPFRRRAMAAIWEWKETVGARPPDPAPATAAAVPTEPPGEELAPERTGVAILDAPLQTMDGLAARLSRHAGKVVVLNVWATWCGPCRVELPSLARLTGQLDAERFAVVGVSMDKQRFPAAEYLRDLGIGFESYWDPTGDLTGTILSARVIPLTLVLAPDGEIIARHEGARDWAHPDIVTAIRQVVDGAGSPQERTARLQEGLR